MRRRENQNNDRLSIGAKSFSEPVFGDVINSSAMVGDVGVK
jgi:hypothetical protein